MKILGKNGVMACAKSVFPGGLKFNIASVNNNYSFFGFFFLVQGAQHQ